MNPRVTIITPAYKRVDYLREAMCSALGQTMPEFELIIADDSNSPEIKALCESYGDKRIRYIPREQNLGIGLNNREAIRVASCDLIAKLDDDDVWEPDFLEKLLPIIESNSDLGVVFCDHWIIDEKGAIQVKTSEEFPFNLKRAALGAGRLNNKIGPVLRDNVVPIAMASIFRRSAINLDKWDAAYGGAYDRWISCSIAISRFAMYYYPEKLTRYRVHGGSGTATRRQKNLEENLALWESIKANKAWASHKKEINQILSRHYLYLGRVVAAANGGRSAVVYFRMSLSARYSLKGLVGYWVSRIGFKV